MVNTRIIVPRSDAAASKEPSALNDSAVTLLWHADICNYQSYVYVRQEGGGMYVRISLIGIGSML